MSTIHQSATAALADTSLGARTVRCTLREAMTMVGKPARTVSGHAATYGAPLNRLPTVLRAEADPAAGTLDEVSTWCVPVTV